jgi:hypothetical protein
MYQFFKNTNLDFCQFLDGIGLEVLYLPLTINEIPHACDMK